MPLASPPPHRGLLTSRHGCSLHPTVPGRFEFWAPAASDARHFHVEEEIQFKTQGNSFFLKSFFHTKLGDFKGKEGAQVQASPRPNPPRCARALP